MSLNQHQNMEGCRWKVLLTLLLGFLFFGASNASAYEVTLIFNLTPTQIADLEILDEYGDPAGISIQDNQAVISYTGNADYFVGPVASSWTVEATQSISVVNQPMLAGYKWISLTPANNGGTVTFTSPDYVPPTTDPGYNFTATFQSWDDGPIPVAKKVNATYADGKITIPGQDIYYAFDEPLILPIDWETMTIKTQYVLCYYYQNAYAVYYSDYYPSSQADKRTGWLTGTVEIADGKTIVTLSPWGELLWVGGKASGFTGDGYWENTQIVFDSVLKPGNEDTSINLSFNGVPEANQYVYISNSDEYAADADVWYTTDENPTVWNFTLNQDNQAGLIIASKAGYRIKDITCSDASLKNANQENGGDYYLYTDEGGAFTLSPVVNPNFGNAWYLDIFNEKVSGATFSVTLEKASDPVYFNIETSDAVDSALKALDDQPQVAFGSYTINPTNIVTRQNVDIAGNSFTYYYTEGQPTPLQLSLNPNLEPGSDYEIVVTSDLAEGSGTYTVTYSRGKYDQIPIVTINLYDGCINGKFTIKAQKVSEGIEPVEFKAMVPAYETPVTPAANGSYTFSLEFTGDVTIQSAFYGKREGKLAIEPASGAASTFYFTFPASYIKGLLDGYTPDEELIPAIYANIVAVDAAGNVVAPGNSDDIYVYYPLDVEIVYGVDFNVNVATEAEGKLDSFNVTPANGYAGIDAYLNRDESDSFYGITITGDNYTGEAVGFEDGIVTFEPAITASGSYTINFPYHAFDITASEGSGSEDEGTAPELGRNYNSQEKTYTFTVTIINGEEPAPSGNELVLNDDSFFPKSGIQYTYAAEESGILRWEVNPGSTIVMGGLYTEGGDLINPTAMNPGAQDEGWAYSSITWAEYNVTAGENYYFQWSKNGDEDEYSLLVTFTAAGSEEPAPSGNELVLNDDSFFPKSGIQYTYAAEESGILRWEVNPGSTIVMGGLYTEGGDLINPAAMNPGAQDEGWAYSSITWAEYNVTAGENYYFQWTKNGDEDEYSLLVTFTAGGSEEPEDGYKKLELDTPYAVNGAGSLKLVYTPEADGVLTATQTGSSDNHLFSQEPEVIDTATGQVSETYLIYSQEVDGNTLKYNVKANTTYYVYAALNMYDDITSVTFSFEESASEDEYAIQIGQTYTVNYKSPNYYYTATEDGTLLVQTNRADSEIAALYGQWFIWADPNHLAAAAATVENANGGWFVKVPMTTGQTVYLWAETSTDIQVTFNWEEAASASTITAVEPSTAVNYDYNTYPEVKIIGEGGVTSYGEVTFSYNNVTQTLNSEYVTTNGWPEFLQIKVATLGLENLVETAALAGAESFTITVKDLKVNNSLVGINSTGEENVTVEDGTVTVTYPISKAPVYLAGESTWPVTFYNNWPAGDESGMATLVFDDEIASVGSVRVSMYPLVPGGDTGEASFNSYTITPAIDGTTVTLDFTGRNYVGSASVVTVIVENAMGKNGMPVSFGESGIALYKQIAFVNEPAVPETPEINALVFEDFEIELGKTPTTVEVPVSIQADEAFTYQGIQFTVTLPEGLTIPEEGGIVLNAPLNGNITWNTSDDLYGAPNTTGVVVLLTEPTEAVEDILTISVTGEYGSLAAGSYPVTIQSVGFSDARGNDIETPEFEAFTGYVTVTEAEVPAEEITIDSVTLNEPSFTEEENDMVSEVVAGESVDMTITVKPADTTDEVEVTADNGATVTENEDGTWTVDTSGVVVPEGEESVTVTITITAGDVEETYELTVKGVLLGDSNDNGVVTVADVVTTANYIAEKPIDAFCFPNANVILTEVDGEQVIDAQDLSATVNIVLENWNGIRNPQNIRRHANRVVSNDRLVASDFHAGHSVIGISLENTMNYSVLQATVELPAGMKVENVTAGPRAAAHELVYNVKGSELNVVLFSYENASFRDGEGSLFNIAVAADENCGDLQMRNIMAADASANGYELSFEGGLNAGTTGIEGIDSDSEGVRYFTVDGIEVVNPEAGQLLIRVANGTAEKVVVK